MATEAALRGMLGLAMRARQMVLGANKVVERVRLKADLVVLMDEDAAGNTRKRVCDVCATYNTRICMVPSGVLGQAVGRPGTRIAALTPGGLRDKILTQLCVLNNGTSQDVKNAEDNGTCQR